MILKKLCLLLGGLIFCFLLTGCGNSNNYLVSIDMDELNQKIENEESFILEVMRTTCSACEAFEPKLERVTAEYEVTVYQINTDEIDADRWSTFSSEYSVTATPTILFFENGKEASIMNRINGNVSEDRLISKLETMGYIQTE